MIKYTEIDFTKSIFYYNEDFLSEIEQKELIDEIESYDMKLYPNSTRKMIWLDKNNRKYDFSRIKLDGEEFKENINKITNKINNFINEIFSKMIECDKIINYESILINKYDGHHSGIGWHSDNEECIPENSIIVSISLGCERDFEIKRMNEKEREYECKKTNIEFISNPFYKDEMHRYKLKSGSIFIMAGSSQKYWYHQLPKYKKKKDNEIRYNLTFREYK